MLSNYYEVARLVGLDPYVMLGRAGLHPSLLRDPENWLPGNRILNLLRDCALRSGRDDFGVLLGETRTFASLGPVSLLLKHEATLRDIITAAIEYRRLINELVHSSLKDDGRTAIFEWNLVPGLSSSQGVALLATIAYRILVFGAGVDWEPDCIHLRDSAPKQLATFRRVFNCALEFDSDFDGMSFNSACLDLPNAFADPGLATHARSLLNLMPGVRHEDTMLERTQSILPFLIANGQTSAEDVAQCLGVPVRTLQRRLADEDQSFSALLNEARRELAIRYLGNSNQPITAVAHHTGYSAVSSFTRWFVSEFGTSPAKWRKLMRKRDTVHSGLVGEAIQATAAPSAVPPSRPRAAHELVNR